MDAPGTDAARPTTPVTYRDVSQAAHPMGSAAGTLTSPARAAAAWVTSTAGSAGKTSSVVGIPAGDTLSK